MKASTVILALLLASLSWSSFAPTVLSQSAGMQLRFFLDAKIDHVDEQASLLYTNTVLLSLATLTGDNGTFRGALVTMNPVYPTFTDCFQIWNRTKIGDQYFWNDSDFVFYSSPFYWNLIHIGQNPYDSYIWPLLIGLDRNVTGANPLQTLGDFSIDVRSAWKIGVPQLIPLQDAKNATLNRLWPGFYVHSYCNGYIQTLKHWYAIQYVFSRTDSEIQAINQQIRGEQISYIGTLVTITTPFVTVLVWGLGAYNNKKRRDRRITGLLSVWRTNLSENERVLTDFSHLLDHLEVDERPLDEVASTYSKMAQAMTEVRSDAREINNLLLWFAGFAQTQGKYLQTRSRTTDKSTVSKELESYAGDYVGIIRARRSHLMTKVQELVKLLDETISSRY